ncbi:MAG TPA: hypothetical protein P5077_09435 [bacterium]|nr:hypothetical protein [bacterium]
MNGFKQFWNKRAKFEKWLIVIGLLALIGVFAAPLAMPHSVRKGTVDGGISAPAKVLRVHDTGANLMAGTIVAVDFAVTDKAGKEFPVTLRMPMSAVRTHDLRTGKAVIVRYDEDDHTKVELVAEK